MEEKGICVLCGKEYDDYGNNPWPLADEGRCCHDCNELVIEARVMRKRQEKEREGKDEEDAEGEDCLSVDVEQMTMVGASAYMAVVNTIMGSEAMKDLFTAAMTRAYSMAKGMGKEDAEAFSKDVALVSILLMLTCEGDSKVMEDMRAVIGDTEDDGE